MQDDTLIGGHQTRFPATHASAIKGAASEDEQVRARAFTTIVSAYWKPVYKYVRMKWHRSNEDAKDTTQAFFTTVMEKQFFRTYNPAQSRFRTFLRLCLDRFIANELKAATRVKRGGNAELLSLDFEGADGELLHETVPSDESIENYFTQEWARTVFSLAVDRLKVLCESGGKTVHFQLFEKYHLSNDNTDLQLSYEQLATQFNLSVSTVTNHLAWGRREFRKIVLDELRNLTATEEEFRQEARDLLGLELP